MPDGDHTSPQPSDEPARRLTHGLIVGTYEGLRAGEAIASVRELGLRPSPERVEGYESDLHGFVVSQDPESGAELAPDSHVFLYIASPPRTVVGGASVGDTVVSDHAKVDVGARVGEGSTEEAPFAAEVHGATHDKSVDREFEEGDLGNPELGGAPEDYAEPALPEYYEPTVADLEAEEEFVEESAEPVEASPVWRGSIPGAVRSRQLTRSLPLSPRVALVGLLVFLVLVALLSLLGSGSHASSGSPTSRSPLPVVPSSAPVAPPAVSPAPVRARTPRRSARPARVAPPAPARVAAHAAPAPVASPVPTPAESVEEHVIREFGP